MMTAPTGQAVFDPFAPPPSISQQSVVSNQAVADQIVQSSPQQAVSVAPQTDDIPTAHDKVTPINQPLLTNVQAGDAGTTPPPVIPNENQVSTKPDDSNQRSLEPLDSLSADFITAPTETFRQSTVAPLAQVVDPTTDTLVDEPDNVPVDDGLPEATYQPINQDVVQTDSNQQQGFELTEDERIALLDQVLTEVEQSASVFDQVVPSAILANDPLNPQGSGVSPARKPETVPSNSASQEAGLIGQVEFEPSSELPVEVEGFLERVEEHADKLPQEIVIADGNVQALPQSHPTQTVIVLPITEEEGQTQSKNVKLSITWLIEWSHKIIKKFVGKVVYRHESNL